MKTRKPLDSVGWLGGSSNGLVINEAARRETIGQREDAAAFLRVWRNYHRTKGWWIVDCGAGQRKHDIRERELMRYTFDAGMERGEEKRGCCHE